MSSDTTTITSIVLFIYIIIIYLLGRFLQCLVLQRRHTLPDRVFKRHTSTRYILLQESVQTGGHKVESTDLHIKLPDRFKKIL